MLLVEASDVVHCPVEVLRLAGVGVAYGDPSVGGQQACALRLTPFGERAAGPHQHPSQGVDHIAISRHS